MVCIYFYDINNLIYGPQSVKTSLNDKVFKIYLLTYI